MKYLLIGLNSAEGKFISLFKEDRNNGATAYIMPLRKVKQIIKKFFYRVKRKTFKIMNNVHLLKITFYSQK